VPNPETDPPLLNSPAPAPGPVRSRHSQRFKPTRPAETPAVGSNHDLSDADAVDAHGHPVGVSPHPGNCRLGCAERDTVQDQYTTRRARHRSAQTARCPYGPARRTTGPSPGKFRHPSHLGPTTGPKQGELTSKPPGIEVHTARQPWPDVEVNFIQPAVSPHLSGSPPHPPSWESPRPHDSPDRPGGR
jgi:hypothetical protein